MVRMADGPLDEGLRVADHVPPVPALALRPAPDHVEVDGRAHALRVVVADRGQVGSVQFAGVFTLAN